MEWKILSVSSEFSAFVLILQTFSGNLKAHGYKTFFILNSVEHEIYPANKYNKSSASGASHARGNW